MTVHDPAVRPAGWQHHPGRSVLGPLDFTLPAPLPLPMAAASPPFLHLIYADDGAYLPAISRQPEGPGPFPTLIVIHGGSGGLGIPFMTDQVLNEGWALDQMLARGYAVCFAEGRMEHEDAYDTGVPFVLDHQDMIAVLRFVARQPWADADRIGFFGVSHGGEMQMKVAAEIGQRGGAPMPAALTLCEPAVIEFLGLEYQGVRKEANLQFHAAIPDSSIDLDNAMRRIEAIPAPLPILVVGRDEDHLQGPFMKLHELLLRAGRNAHWLSFSHPDHAYQLGPRRSADGYCPDSVQVATLEAVLAFLDLHVREKDRRDMDGRNKEARNRDAGDAR